MDRPAVDSEPLGDLRLPQPLLQIVSQQRALLPSDHSRLRSGEAHVGRSARPSPAAHPTKTGPLTVTAECDTFTRQKGEITAAANNRCAQRASAGVHADGRACCVPQAARTHTPAPPCAPAGSPVSSHGRLPGRFFRWPSSSDAVASVSAAGLVTTHAPGTVVIAANAEGVVGTVSLVVLAR